MAMKCLYILESTLNYISFESTLKQMLSFKCFFVVFFFGGGSGFVFWYFLCVFFSTIEFSKFFKLLKKNI